MGRARDARARAGERDERAGVDGRVSILGRHERERERAMGDAWERRDGDARWRTRSTRATRAGARRATTPTRAGSAVDLAGKPNEEVKVLVVGATVYIGKFVTRELCARGYDGRRSRERRAVSVERRARTTRRRCLRTPP